MTSYQAIPGSAFRVDKPAARVRSTKSAKRGKTTAPQPSNTRRSAPASVQPQKKSLFTPLFSLGVMAALYFGWTRRNEYYLTAEHGTGYALGIIGGVLMLLLLLYPLKKRFGHLHLIFSTKNWFSLHMILGIVGPVLVLYHCNFSLGSINSNVTLVCMLLMVSSGLVGRYIYAKIHYGLYDKQSSLQALQQHKVFSKRKLHGDQEVFSFISPEVYERLKAFEKNVLRPRSLFGNLRRMILLSITTRWAYLTLGWRLRRYHNSRRAFGLLPPQQRKRLMRTLCYYLGTYLAGVRKISEVSFYERLFSLWHVLHLPIFFMLIITGFIHVYAVHVY